MRLLLFSDLHRDLAAARALAERSAGFDVVVGAGDFGSVRRGLQEVIDALAIIDRPCVLVPGNAESDEELREACRGWKLAHVLHGEGVTIGGVPFFGLGAAVPVTPFGSWSFDLDEATAEGMLAGCPAGAVLVTHSPPYGHVDEGGGGEHLGSRAVLATVERTEPRLVVCGHIHACWARRSEIGSSQVVNAGPAGVEVTL